MTTRFSNSLIDKIQTENILLINTEWEDQEKKSEACSLLAILISISFELFIRIIDLNTMKDDR